MSKINRRLFLKGATCTAAGAITTGILPGTARMALGAGGSNRVIVAINPDGGKDALSLYMPAGGALSDHNTALVANRTASTFDIGNGLAPIFGGQISLHQRATFLQQEALAGRMNVIWNVGYDLNRQHSRSHATARDNMEACTASATEAGMLTQGIVKKWQAAGGLSNTTNVLDSSGGNTGLTNGGARVIATPNLRNFSFGAFQGEGNLRVNALFDSTLADSSTDNATKTAITGAITSAKADVALVQEAADYRDTIIGLFPNTSLGRQLADIAAAIIKLPTCFAIAKYGGHDTHSNQDSDQNGGRFWNLVGQLNDALDAFYQVLAAAPGGSRADDVVCISYSEFGRTYRENGSNGTDHAMGAPMMMMGPAVAGGLFGTVDDASLAVTRNYQNPTTHIARVWGDAINWAGGDASATLSPADTTTLGTLA